ncbi:hypothetical protein OPV22_022478 [Ensete ventricosum]|uniref:Uncharacterized protein n=1 Tax=Ensete ventricosum TaxID=4639 RepID=A0AAV8QJM3_ENSVE|nr:hypothetical protein OPV22_022478 [Ensete ventricosum]
MRSSRSEEASGLPVDLERAVGRGRPKDWKERDKSSLRLLFRASIDCTKKKVFWLQNLLHTRKKAVAFPWHILSHPVAA